MPLSREMKTILPIAYKMSPIRALEYLKRRGANSIETWDYDDLSAKMHSKAFTVAKTLGADVLQDIYNAVQKAKADGTTIKDFIANLKPSLEAKGWWGVKEINGKVVTLGTPSRLALILDTNIKTSYAQGRWESMMNIAKFRPWFVYEQIHRKTAREQHKQFDKHIYHYTNPIVQNIFPPRGFGCDCSMRAVNDEEKNKLVSEGYILVEQGSEQDNIDKRNINDEMKNFDPIGNYKPEIKDYQPRIREALKQVLSKNDQMEQKNLAIAKQTRILAIKNELNKIKKTMESKKSKENQLKEVNFKLNLINQQIQKLKNSGGVDQDQIKNLIVSHTAMLLLANNLKN